MTVFKKGHSGDKILEITKHLVDYGVLDEPKDLFDAEVARAVRAFQSKMVDSRGRPLEVDSKVGKLTLWALENDDHTSAFSPVPDSFYDILDNLNQCLIGHMALKFGLEEMRKGARELIGNNRGEFVAKYHRVDPSALDDDWAWCAAFVSWCVKQASDSLDMDMPFKYTGGARDILNQAKKATTPAYVVDTKDGGEPRTGDLVVWYRDKLAGWKGHVGIVHSFENGILYVLEGNRGRFPAPVRVYDYVWGRMPKLLGIVRLR